MLQENSHIRKTSTLLKTLETDFGEENQMSLLLKESDLNKSSNIAESPRKSPGIAVGEVNHQ